MRWSIAFVAALAFVLTGCTTTGAGGTYDLAEYSITGPSALDPGSQSIEITNSGEFPHTLVVTNSDGQVVASTDLVQPGEVAGLDFDLGDGVYQFTCRIVTQTDDGTIVDHFQEGMNLSISVGD